MRSKSVYLQIGLLIIIASLPFWFIQTQFTLSIFTLTFIWLSLAVAWNMISGFGGQVSFGHSTFFGLGAYTTVLLLLHSHLSPWIGMLIGGLVAAVVSTSLGILFRLRGIYFSLATFSVTLVFQQIATFWSSLTGGDVGLSVPLLGNSPWMFQFQNKLWYYYIALACAAVYFVISKTVFRSKLGLLLRAIGDDEAAAKSTGVHSLKVKMFALGLSAFLTAIVGSVYVQYVGFIDPSSAFGYTVATQIAILAMAGGAGTVWGPVLGAAVLYPLQQELSSQLGFLPSGVALMIYAACVIVIIASDPRGLLSLLQRFIGWARQPKKRTSVISSQQDKVLVQGGEPNGGPEH